MITLGCVFRNTDVYNEIKDAVAFLADSLLAEEKSPHLGSIYYFLRKSGVEVDLQTVGHAYKEVLPRNDRNYMTDEEVDEYTLRNYDQAVKRASKSRDVEINKELGDDKTELDVVIGLLNMFAKTNVNVTETKTIHAQMREALWKAMQKQLNLPMNRRPTTSKEWRDLLNQALGYDALGIEDVSGRVNSMADLFDAMQEELERAYRDLGDNADPMIMARWEQAVNTLRRAAYSLIFSKPEARNMVMGLMKEAGYTKQLATGREVLDWTKLAGDIGTVDDVRDIVERVVRTAGYDQRVVEAVKEALVEEFNELRTEVITKQIEQEERIAREGTKYTQDEAGLSQALGTQSVAEWIRTENIENLEQLEQAANTILAGKKYLPAVRAQIIQRLKDFYTRNYAKIANREAKEAVRDILGGMSALEWIKANGIQTQSELYDTLAKSLRDRGLSDEAFAEIIKEFNRILDLDNRAEKELQRREDAIGRNAQAKTDIRRLAELYNLGLFDTADHRVLLHRLLGVEGTTAQDLDDIAQIARAASELAKWVDKNLGDDVFATRQYQYLQRHIDRLVARNINNKTGLLKILGVIRAFFDLMLSGLLAGPFTIIENIWSGIKAGWGSMITGPGKVSKEDREIFWNMLYDVAASGQPYGEEVGQFAPRELFSNMLEFKWKDGTPAEKALSLLYLLHLPGRIGLLAFDSANKVYATNMHFKHAIFQALRQAGMDDVTINNFMNHALNGQAFEAAKDQAEEILNQVNANLPPKFRREVTPKAIISLANDVVKANLNANQVIPIEVIREAAKGAYHVAGYGLGHEPNNYLSKAIAGIRKDWRQREEEFIRRKDWNALATHRMVTMFINSVVIKFLGGATNWMYLRFQEAGLGLVTGFVGGRPNRNINDFSNREEIRAAIRERQLARHQIGRAIVGISMGLMSTMLMALLYASDEEDEVLISEWQKKIQDLQKKRGQALQQALIDAGVEGVTKENVTEKKAVLISQWKEELAAAQYKINPYMKIKSSWMLKRGFLKVAPDALLIKYYMNTEPNNLTAALKYAQQTTGMGSPYSADEKFEGAMKMARAGDMDGANGALGNIIGSSFQVPMYRAYKDWGKLTQWVAGKDVQSDYRDPTSFTEGLLGGGMLEDIGVYTPKISITVLDGIGVVSRERFREHGINTLGDLQRNPEWWKLTYIDDNGTERPILGPADQVQAKQHFEQYNKEDLR